MESMRIIRRMLVAAVVFYLHFRILARPDTSMPSSIAWRDKKEDEFSQSGSIKTTTKTIQGFTNPIYSGPYGRIAFRLHELNDMTVNPPGKYDPVPAHQCQNTSDLASTLAHRGVLDFKVSISTDLNMIFIGDSIASQLSQAFDATLLEPHYDYSNSVKSHFRHRTYDAHICVTASTPIRGGGVSAYMRNNFMMSYSNMMNHGVCGHGDKKWGLDVVSSLINNQHRHPVNTLQQRYKSDSQSEKERSYSTQRVGSFNAAILKIPALGWIKDIRSVTKERIIEEIDLIGKYFGVDTVIISTLTFSNNVKTLDDWKGIQKVNEMIRQIAKSWAFSPTKDLNSVSWILVQELGNLTNQMIWTNAKNIGYNVTLDFSSHGWDAINTGFLLDRFEHASAFHWPPSIPMVCAERPNGTNVRDCTRNKISPDGMHWCTATLGPRYSASIACLLGCVYNGEFGYLVGVVETFNIMNRSVRVCEDECNQRFMSLVPVDVEWIDAGATLYSRA